MPSIMPDEFCMNITKYEKITTTDFSVDCLFPHPAPPIGTKLIEDSWLDSDFSLGKLTGLRILRITFPIGCNPFLRVAMFLC